MDNSLEALEKLVLEKVEEGLFASVEEAVESIRAWLDDLERQVILEQMRNEDA